MIHREPNRSKKSLRLREGGWDKEKNQKNQLKIRECALPWQCKNVAEMQKNQID